MEEATLKDLAPFWVDLRGNQTKSDVPDGCVKHCRIKGAVLMMAEGHWGAA